MIRIRNVPLKQIVDDIIELYPNCTKVGLVGSYARGEAKPKSDVDIVIWFPAGTDGWMMVSKDDKLWAKYNKRTIGKVVDFIIRVRGDGRSCGQHRYRTGSGLLTPEVILVKNKRRKNEKK